MRIKRNKNPLFRKGAFVSAIVLFFVIISFTPVSKTIKNGVFLFSSSAQSFFFKQGSALYQLGEVLFGIEKVKDEITELRLENSKLYSMLVLQREILEENRAFRSALDIGLKDDFNLIFADIIGSTNEGLILGSGEKVGVKKGLSVVTPDKSLVGLVSEVYADFSIITLITCSETSFEVVIQGEEDSVGVLRGGDELMTIELISRDSKVAIGDAVTTFPQEGLHPRGLFVGSVEELVESDVEAFTEAKVRPGFQINNLKFLFILDK